jgi:hypothetical protein
MNIEGFPGVANAPNITPDRETGGGNWTDDEFARAIREGIGHDGRTIFPLMPYSEYKPTFGRRCGFDCGVLAIVAAGKECLASDASELSGKCLGAKRAATCNRAYPRSEFDG